MTRLGSSSRLTGGLAWAVCGLTVAVAVAIVVLAIADPNTAGPAHMSRSGPTAHDRPAGGYVPYAVLTAIVFSAFALVGAVVAASTTPRGHSRTSAPACVRSST
jgi:putative exporter of polyketide antibiotics